MAIQPRSSVQIRDFPGLVTNADPNDIPEGAAEVQVNVSSARAMELNVRLGYREVTFES